MVTRMSILHNGDAIPIRETSHILLALALHALLLLLLLPARVPRPLPRSAGIDPQPSRKRETCSLSSRTCATNSCTFLNASSLSRTTYHENTKFQLN